MRDTPLSHLLSLIPTRLAMTNTPRILMCPPDHYGIEYEINPWMDRRQGADRHLAMTQWQDLRRLLEQAGAAIDCLEPVAGMPDLVFTANAAMICGKVAIPGPLPPSAAAGRRAVRPDLAGGTRLRASRPETGHLFRRGRRRPVLRRDAAGRISHSHGDRRSSAGRRPVGLPRDLAGTGRSALLPPRHLLLSVGPRCGDLLSAGLRRLRPACLARGGRRVDSCGGGRGLELRLQRGRRRADGDYERRLPGPAPRVGSRAGTRPLPRRWASSSNRADGQVPHLATGRRGERPAGSTRPDTSASRTSSRGRGSWRNNQGIQKGGTLISTNCR